MARLIGLLLLVISMTAFAEGGFVNKWWKQEYEGIQQQQQEVYQKKAATRCEKKIEKYTRGTRDYPTSSYYRWKLRSWKRRCEEDSSDNPYINE